MLKILTFSFDSYYSNTILPSPITNIDKSLVNIIKGEINIEHKKYILENFYHGYVHLTVDKFCEFLYYLKSQFSKKPYIFQNKKISIVATFILNLFNGYNPYCDFFNLKCHFLFYKHTYFSSNHTPSYFWEYDVGQAINNVDEKLLNLILISTDLIYLIEDLKKE